MFSRSVFPASYFTPNYFPETGAELPVIVGGGAVVAGLSRAQYFQQLSMAEYYRMEARAVQIRRMREAEAKLRFELAMVRLRELENEARQRMMLQRAVVATVLAEA